MAKFPSHEDDLFALRLARSAPDLWPMLKALYGQHPAYDCFRDGLLETLRKGWAAHPADLKRLDLQSDLEPDWFQRAGMAGYVFYIDCFAGTLKGVLDKLDFLEDLGITYVHFMPCLKLRPSDSDGGYSVMDYRAINPAYGTMAEFEEVSAALHQRGISVAVDLVLNHTAKEHVWAVAAAKADQRYQDYHLMIDNPAMPRAFQASLVEVFPDNAPGSFTDYPHFGKWVWNTFNKQQWDLNWANPAVFLDITEIVLNLASRGVDVLRLDAVAFMWKRLGTRCQSKPEVQMLLQALRACCRIACPAVLHREQAIVAPAEMLRYLGRGKHDWREGNLAYHNSLMVQFWGALATCDALITRNVLATHFPYFLTNATFATYIRRHDAIGWAVTDEDARAMNLSGHAHRAFLFNFYEGTFPGTFARGALFQGNKATGNKRISGGIASLTGLEKAQTEGDFGEAELAVQRILLGHALIDGLGAIPLIYMGVELAMLNDHSYLGVPELAHDSRWIQRPMMDWQAAKFHHSDEGAAEQVFRGVKDILHRRKLTPALHAAHPVRIVDCGPTALFAFVRARPTGAQLGLFNMTEHWLNLPEAAVRAHGVILMQDALSDALVVAHQGQIALPPNARDWLT